MGKLNICKHLLTPHHRRRSIFQCEGLFHRSKNNHNNSHVQRGWPPREPRIVFWARKLHWPPES